MQFNRTIYTMQTLCHVLVDMYPDTKHRMSMWLHQCSNAHFRGHFGWKVVTQLWNYKVHAVSCLLQHRSLSDLQHDLSCFQNVVSTTMTYLFTMHFNFRARNSVFWCSVRGALLLRMRRWTSAARRIKDAQQSFSSRSKPQNCRMAVALFRHHPAVTNSLSSSRLGTISTRWRCCPRPRPG